MVQTQTNVVAGQIDSDSLRGLAKAVDPWQAQFDQLSSGPFRSTMRYLQLGSLIFYTQSWNQRINCTACPPPGFLMIGGPINAKSEVTWCGEHLNWQRIAFEAGGNEIEFSTSAIGNHMVLLVPYDILKQFVDEGIFQQLLKPRHTYTCSATFRTLYMNQLLKILEELQTGACDQPSAQSTKALIFEIMTGLAEEFSRPGNTATRPVTTKRARAMRRVVEYTRTHDGLTPVPQLAGIAGVSQRTLEYTFKDQFGLSPVQFVRILHMNRSRELLMEAEPGSKSIRDIANQCGFRHHGRFSIEYRKLFGELPSQTLRQARARHDWSLKNLME